eukprot:2077068-Rhodomonas_salina.2
MGLWNVLAPLLKAQPGNRHAQPARNQRECSAFAVQFCWFGFDFAVQSVSLACAVRARAYA